jgi:hypothetical protein
MMAKWGNEDLTDKIINACIIVHKNQFPAFRKHLIFIQDLFSFSPIPPLSP